MKNKIKKLLNSKLTLFTSGLMQVFLVSVNVYQLAHKHYIGAFIVGFLISLIWSYNVKRISFSDKWDRYIYAFGAAVGTIVGLSLSELIYE